MSTTIRVFPQAGSVGAQRNQIAKKNQQIVSLRNQITQLRQQLAAFSAGSMYGGYSSSYGGYPSSYGTPQTYPTSYSNPYQRTSSAFSGWGALLGGLFGGQSPSLPPQKVAYAPTQVFEQSPIQSSPYGYAPGTESDFGGWQ